MVVTGSSKNKSQRRKIFQQYNEWNRDYWHQDLEVFCIRFRIPSFVLCAFYFQWNWEMEDWCFTPLFSSTLKIVIIKKHTLHICLNAVIVFVKKMLDLMLSWMTEVCWYRLTTNFCSLFWLFPRHDALTTYVVYGE